MERVFQQPTKYKQRQGTGKVPAVEWPVQEISRDEVKKTIECMKKGKAAGCSCLPIDFIKHLGESGVDMMYEILKRVWEGNKCQKSGRKVRSSPHTNKTKSTVIRPVLLYGAECWRVGKKEEQILEKTDMRMLRRIKYITLRECGHQKGARSEEH